MNNVKSGKNYADIVYNAIVSDIVDQKLKAGDKLNDKELAAKLGISRTPVREALIMLEQDGFVVTIARDGTYVREFTRDDIREIYIVREALEVMAARLGAKIINDDDLALLGNLVIQMDEAAKSKNTNDFIRLDYEFHNLIVSSANVQLLYRTCNNLGLLRASILAKGEHYIENLVMYNSQHKKIYEAFTQHDGELAEKLISEHIQYGKMVLLLNR